MEIAEPVTVRCSALVVRGDCILLCRRPTTDIWVLAGGSPRQSEGAWECARREVSQETGLAVTPDRVAFVLDGTSPKGEQHLFEIIFSATEDDPSATPCGHSTRPQTARPTKGPWCSPRDAATRRDLVDFHAWSRTALRT